jgi:hypothetical protein
LATWIRKIAGASIILAPIEDRPVGQTTRTSDNVKAQCIFVLHPDAKVTITVPELNITEELKVDLRSILIS